MRELESAYNESFDRVNKSGENIDRAVELCDLAYNEAMQFHIGVPGTNQGYLDNYHSRTDELIAACCEGFIHKARMETLKDYKAKVRAYRDNLEVLIEALKLRMAECSKKEVKAELVGDDLTFAQLKAYLDGSIADQEMVRKRDESIAKARDAVLERLADDSFRLPRDKKADTHAKQEEMKHEFVNMVNEFVEAAFADIGLDNLDIVLEAASQIKGEEKVKYMANVVAPQMERAAKPTLQMKKDARVKVSDYCNFHHTSVPMDAQAVQEGLRLHNSGGVADNSQKSDFTISEITDRMTHLHMQLGIPLYLM